MRVDNISGYFDVRKYKAGVRYADRDLKADSDVIMFNVRYTPENLPQDLAAYAKEHKNEDGTSVFYVPFKVGARCKWFDKDGRPTERPTNAELDGERWTVCVDYRTLKGDPAKLEACGHWANGILILSCGGDMFADMRKEPQTVEQVPQPPVTETATATPEQVAQAIKPATFDASEDPLPF